jgi:hypothetical protein
MQNFAGKVAERVECIRPHAEAFGIQLGQCLTEAIPSVVEEWLKEREAHNNTKEQLKDARGWLDERYADLTEADAHSEHLEAEKQKLCRIARRALEITKTWNANYAEVEELEKKLEAIEGSIGEACSE